METLETPSDYTVDVLPNIPNLGALYAQGVAGSVRPASRGGELAVPKVVYRVGNVDTAELEPQLRAYQRLIGEPALDQLSAAYLHVLAFPLAMALMARPDFPLPMLGMVHLANDAVLLKPVELGDVLRVRTWAQNLRPHAKGTQIDIVAEIWVVSPDGGSPTLAWQGVSTYLAKGVDAGRLSSDVVAAVETIPAVELVETKGIKTLPYPTAQWALTPGTGRTYAAVSGDRNPIHTSPLAAKAFGFPRSIAHGMYTAARALAEVGPARRGETYRWTVEFAKPVLLPSKVDVAITPSVEHPSPDAGARPTYTYQGWNSKKGHRHFTGTVTQI